MIKFKATQFIKNGLQLDSRDKSIIVDKYLNAADGLYAAGKKFH